MKEKSRQLAFCGVLSALAVAAMLLGSVVPFATFCCPILAMMALLPILLEYGARLALTAYVAVSALVLLLVADKESAFLFVFLGVYPILCPILERLHSKFLQLLLKLLYFNSATAALYALLIFVFQLSAVTEEFSGATRGFFLLLLALANLTFLLLDIALRRLKALYRNKLRRTLFHLK